MDAAYWAAQGGTLIEQGTVTSYEYKIIELSGFRYNDTKVIGPINLETRLQLYSRTLPHMVSGQYFGILDNTAGFENDFSFDAIKQVDHLLLDQGVTHYCGATITNDVGYSKLIKLAQTYMETIGLNGALIRVPNYEDAKAFVLEKIAAAATARDAQPLHNPH
ncbi:hypothetical protein EOI86_07045 [Hwanghaeella grinnelliae]|uniref:Uncharacterized protein n=1 Tax=Hwanghaeella grinnelliae TaxID=2500179 RepID=A0A3S2VRV3_9PROT|nr:hypothetical protein [Hwanghaeella grinnelliae]RVU39007.1 hypothetical protein EOI86_07045 [Hwanghaeella grinnelliae]